MYESLTSSVQQCSRKASPFSYGIKNVADACSWREIFTIPIGAPLVNYDLLTQPGKIKLQDLQTHCMRI